MKGKLFILFVMVGVPIMTLSLVAWLIMITMGALHSILGIVPALSFGWSMIVALAIFATITYSLISAAAGPPPDPRHRL